VPLEVQDHKAAQELQALLELAQPDQQVQLGYRVPLVFKAAQELQAQLELVLRVLLV
jgi:hypothetical protein